MIVLSKATKKETKDFSKREWHGVDKEHYGKHVEWKEKKFLYKATENDVIVGTISGEHESGVVHIGAIIVAAEKRGKGIGTLLMKRAEEFAKEYKAHKIYLSTGKTWKARKFYEGLGYKKIADMPNHHFHTDWVMYAKFI